MWEHCGCWGDSTQQCSHGSSDPTVLPDHGRRGGLLCDRLRVLLFTGRCQKHPCGIILDILTEAEQYVQKNPWNQDCENSSCVVLKFFLWRIICQWLVAVQNFFLVHCHPCIMCFYSTLSGTKQHEGSASGRLAAYYSYGQLHCSNCGSVGKVRATGTIFMINHSL